MVDPRVSKGGDDDMTPDERMEYLRERVSV